MASPATLPNPTPVPPPADPQAIRACLTQTLAAEFDHEWRVVLDLVKQSQNLSKLHSMLQKWRHIAYQEMLDPGSYYRTLAKVEQIQRSGGNPDGVPFEQMQTLIRDRQGRA